MPRHEPPDDLKERLAHYLAGKLGDAKEEGVGDPVAVAATLRDRFARYMAPSDLRPGDVCRQKAGLSSFRKYSILIMVRMLNPDDRFDQAIILDYMKRAYANRIDCIVAATHDDEEDTTFLPCDSGTLERFDPVAF